ncbi:hypothetical protein EW145_g3727 [Phellinidium pouzarii]|uniref:Uncharacterized protein n=1 Tax=Phellinidium pouzarii TaxID=167371 RepID=A0A4S4L623_9AGAM|nr:hypothetical protein EW145_g3727 [Phellinidium pouzarii]
MTDPRALLGLPPTSEKLEQYLKQLANITAFDQVPTPEIKSYPDALYTNYFPLGLSLMFIPKDGPKPITEADARSDKLALDSVDIYNINIAPEPNGAKTMPKSSTSSAMVYSPHPVNPLSLPLQPSQDTSKPRPPEISITTTLTGKDILSVLGEPDRKGGGAGPASGSIGIWCEWTRDGIMIEFGGVEARGPQAWERGKDAKWEVLTLFRPKDL